MPDFGGIDFSPMVVLLLIMVLQKLLAGAAADIAASAVTARIIDGKAAAATLRARIGDEVIKFRAATRRAPGLAVVLVGEDLGERGLCPVQSGTREAGMESFEHKLAATASQDELVALVDRLNADPAVDGILVQLPLPRTSTRMPSSPGSTPTRMSTAFPGQCRAAGDRD